MTQDLAKIAKGLTKAQREAILGARWIHPGGQDAIALVDFTGPWPEGIAQFFILKVDRLTPLGCSLWAYLQDNHHAG